MASRRTEQRLYDELLETHGQAVAEAFRRAMDDLRREADVQRLIAAVAAGRVEQALDALRMSDAAYDDLLDAIRTAYVESGRLTAELAGPELIIRFHARNPAAERWLADHSSGLVRRITDTQRQAVREHLRAGMAAGNNPRTTALDIVGRVDRATGKRVGGVLGLTPQQAGYVRSAREELLSGDPGALQNYLSRVRRDKRFDRTVARAIRDKAPVDADTVERAVRNYERRLLALRGEMIGRTESLTALRAAKHEAYRQAIEAGTIRERDVRRTWSSVGDTRVRHTHQILDGETVGFSQPFQSPSGARMLFPGDTSLGAGPEEVIACRCDVNYRVDFLSNLG